MTYLSESHAWLGRIERVSDPHRLNRIINDPSIYPYVKGYAVTPLDISPMLANPRNHALMGEHGGVLFCRHFAGLYEAHTQILPAGRGKWAVGAVKAALHWMFSNTDAIEILTKCPNKRARALATVIGGTPQWRAKRGWVMDNDPIPVDIYGLSIQSWMNTAGGLIERGNWFHRRLDEEVKKMGGSEPPHEDDTTHNRYVGAAVEMALGGQMNKATVFYNRWAALSGYARIQLISDNPPVFSLGTCHVQVLDKDLRVTSCRLEQPLEQAH